MKISTSVDRSYPGKLALFGFLMFFLGMASPALAEVKYLKCGSADNLITIDFDKSTVNGAPVTITPTSIQWASVNKYPHGSGQDIVTQRFRIDRVTGTFTSSIEVQFPGGFNPGTPTTVPCLPVAAPAVKF